MTRSEIYTMVQSFGLPATYYSFPNNQAPALPYVVYYYPNRDDYYADDYNYVKIENLRIELYTETKDFELEDTIESRITLPYSKDVIYLDDEKMYQITYECEFILTPEPTPTNTNESEEVNSGE